MIRTKMNYLKRVNSRTGRPERSECKIGSSNCSATPTLDELSVGLEIVRADGCTTLVFDPVIDLGAAPAVYVCEKWSYMPSFEVDLPHLLQGAVFWIVR